MGATYDDELRGLQARAYGPQADIRDDVPAQVRLQELEDARRQLAPQRLDGVNLPEPTVDPFEESGSDDESPCIDDEPKRPTHDFLRRLAELARAVGARLARVRRSTVLIALGLTVIVSVIATTLILVERVQPDPLQTGADQIARLTIDSSYEAPEMFQNMGTEGDAALAFREFHGLRAVVTDGGWFSGGAEGECLSVFLVTDGEKSDSNSFSGQIRGGCSAGPFPAMTQLLANDEDLPDELQSAFPGPTALQFVYDTANQEIVIFAGE